VDGVSPHTIISRTDAAIAGYGQTVTLQRTAVDLTTGMISVTETIDCPAAVRTSAPQALEGGDVVDIRVVVTPTGLGSFGLPSRDDRIVINGNPSNIETIGPLYYGGQLCRVNLLCRG
jgi:hypothetical protein